MIRRHTISTLTDTRFPYTTRFRSDIEILPRPVFLLGLLTATSWTSSTEDRLSAREQKLFAGRQGLLRRRNGSLRIINRRRGRRGFGAWCGRHGTLRIQSSRRDPAKIGQAACRGRGCQKG